MIDAEHNYNDFLIQSLYQTKIIKQHNANINSIDFSSDGKKILTSGDDDKIIECNMEKQVKRANQMEATFKEMNISIYGCVHALYTKNENEIVVSGKFDARIIIISLQTMSIVKFLYGHKEQITSMIVNRNKNLLLSTSRDYQTYLWNISSRTCIRAFSFSLYATFDINGDAICQAKIEVAEFSPKESVIILYDREEIESSHPVIKRYDSIKGEIKAIKITNNNEFIVAMLVTELYVINTEKERVDFIIRMRPEENSIHKVFDISPDSNIIVVGDERGVVTFWNITKGNEIMRKNYHLMGCHAMKFNPFYMQIATASEIVFLLEPNYDKKNIVSAI